MQPLRDWLYTPLSYRYVDPAKNRILGERKYVNVEVPRAIADLKCFKCKTPIVDLRSFKCHNWAYARPALLEVLERVARSN